MKVLYLVNQYPKNSHTFVRREIRGVEAEGIEVVRVSIRPAANDLVEMEDQKEAERTRFLLEHGAGGLILPMALTFLRHPLRFLSALGYAFQLSRRAARGFGVHLAYLAEACALLRICKAEKVTHVHVHFGTNPPLVAMLNQRLGGPGFSFTAHGPEEYFRALSLKLSEKVAASRFVATISRYGRSQMQFFAAPEIQDRIHVVHCALDDSFLNADSGGAPKGSRFVFIGRFTQQKQPLVLLAAAAEVAATGEDFHIDLVGDGYLRPVIEEAIQHHGLEKHITLHGTCDGAKIRSLLQNSLAMVLPSSAEGLPVVLMEAMALQRPVVTTFVAAIPELVRNGVEGWLVPTGDAKAFAAAMLEALHTSPEQLARMGKAASERVRERHDIRVSAARMVALFEKYGDKN